MGRVQLKMPHQLSKLHPLKTDATHFVPANLDERGVGMEHMTSSTKKCSHPGHAFNDAKRIADLKVG